MSSKLEYILTNSLKSDSISYLKSHPEDFEEALELAIADKHPHSWRAAWLLWSCMEKNDRRVQKYLDRIIDTLPSKSDGHARELLMILQQMELEDEQEGKVFDICISIWEKIQKQPSVRLNAFKLMLMIVKKYPELLNEITFLTESQYTDTLSEGVKHSISKMIDKNLGNVKTNIIKD